MPFRVKKGQKIRNVLDTKKGVYRTYYAGESVPGDYDLPKDYIYNRIVEDKNEESFHFKKVKKIKEEKEEKEKKEKKEKLNGYHNRGDE